MSITPAQFSLGAIGSPNTSAFSLNRGKVYNSTGELSSALYSIQDAWREKYGAQFADGEAMSVDELKEFMHQEFASYGVSFVDYNPSDVVEGKHLVYIDETNLQKMASDPAYRAENLALMRRECSGLGGFTVRDSRGTTEFRPTGSVFSLAEENPNVGGSRYSGMMRSASMTTGEPAKTSGGGKSKSLLQIMAERLEEIREKALARKEEEERITELAARRKKTAVVKSDDSAVVPGPDAVLRTGIDLTA